jgi:hypothetical protein
MVDRCADRNVRVINVRSKIRDETLLEFCLLSFNLSFRNVIVYLPVIPFRYPPSWWVSALTSILMNVLGRKLRGIDFLISWISFLKPSSSRTKDCIDCLVGRMIIALDTRSASREKQEPRKKVLLKNSNVFQMASWRCCPILRACST